MSTISKRKQKRSYIEAYYWNESKTFWFGPLKIGTEAEGFGLVRIFLYQKQFVSVLARSEPIWFGPEIVWGEAERSYVIKTLIDRSKGFDLVPLLLERKQNILIWSAFFQNWSKIFWFGLLIIGTKAKRFYLVCLLSQLKENILIWSAYYRNESKTFWFGLLIIGKKAKQFDLLLKLSHQKVSIWSIRTCIYKLQNFISRKLKRLPTPVWRVGESLSDLQ